MKTETITKLLSNLTGMDVELLDHAACFAVDSVNPGDLYAIRITGHYGCSQTLGWKAPANEENYARSLVTCFCSKYRIIDPGRIGGDHSPEILERGATQWHRDFCFPPKEMRERLNRKFMESPLRWARSTLYPTQYGIGCWILFGRRADLIAALGAHLENAGVDYTNEYSKAQWVLRFKTGLPYAANEALLAEFETNNQ